LNLDKTAKNLREQKKIINIDKSNKISNKDISIYSEYVNTVKINQKSDNYLSLYEKKRFKNSFHRLGIFFIDDKNTSNKFYYEIYIRKIEIEDNNYIDDIFFYDITHLIVHKQEINSQNNNNQKLFAKFTHEFKTPLNSVISIISNIKDSEKKLSESISSKLEIIENLSNYLIFLASDIIQFATLNEISEVNLNLSALDIREILVFCYQILKSLLILNKSKNDNIISELNDYEIINLYIESDEIRIKQILLNFISNSVKFTKQGKIVIKANKKTLNGKNYLKISVIDTGIGIKNEDQKLLFEEYQTIENGKSLNKLHNSLGSGLGLSICKMLCKKLDINLSVKSEYLKGSTFSIVIPLNNEDIDSKIIRFTSKTSKNTSENKITDKLSFEKLENYYENINNTNINILESDLNERHIKENNSSILNNSRLDNIANIEVDSSNAVTLRRSDIVPLYSMKSFNYNNCFTSRPTSIKYKDFNSVKTFSIIRNTNLQISNNPHKNRILHYYSHKNNFDGSKNFCLKKVSFGNLLDIKNTENEKGKVFNLYLILYKNFLLSFKLIN